MKFALLVLLAALFACAHVPDNPLEELQTKETVTISDCSFVDTKQDTYEITCPPHFNRWPFYSFALIFLIITLFIYLNVEEEAADEIIIPLLLSLVNAILWMLWGPFWLFLLLEAVIIVAWMKFGLHTYKKPIITIFIAIFTALSIFTLISSTINKNEIKINKKEKTVGFKATTFLGEERSIVAEMSKVSFSSFHYAGDDESSGVYIINLSFEELSLKENVLSLNKKEHASAIVDFLNGLRLGTR